MLRLPECAVVTVLLPMLFACFKPVADLPPLNFDQVPYSNDFLEVSDARVSVFDTSLTCPDGEAARVFALWREGLEVDAPVAILLHGGAFDYVLSPATGDGRPARTYRADSRLTRAWSVTKVWETLGLNTLDPVDPQEANLGALPAALTDAGFVTVVPANCWGDLWHNEAGVVDNDAEAEGFARDGRAAANNALRMITDPDFALEQGFQVPVSVDTGQIHLIGIGDGGRGVAELLLREPAAAVAGALVDSPPDLLSAWLSDPVTFGDEAAGLLPIFGEEALLRVDDFSLRAAADGGRLPPRVGLVWSSADPQVPAAAIAPTAATLAAAGAWVDDRADAAHTALNSDITLARAAALYLLDGTRPSDAPAPVAR